MSLKTQTIKNVTSSWMSLLVNGIIGFFLAPFIIHHLGDDAYGLWILIYSITGSYGLFDLGIRSSVVRYVSKFQALGDRAELSRLLSTTLFAYSIVGFIATAVTVSGAIYLDRIFHIPVGFLHSARLLFLMVGLSLAVDFPLGVGGGVLDALQKFYLANLTRLTSSVLRAILIVIALSRGKGLLTLGLITVVLPLIASSVRVFMALRLLRVPISARYVNRNTFRQMAGYSSATLIIMIAARLRFRTDAIVIGSFLSAAAITMFAIGSRLVSFATDIVVSLAEVFTPMASQFEARKDMQALQRMFVLGSRACGIVMFPCTVILVVLGKSVIRVWVGQRYVADAYPVLLILVLATTLWTSQATSGRVLMGTGRHRTMALIVLIEGIANLVLSIVLVRPYGIVGDAMGTAIPLAITSIFFLPQYLCSTLNLSVLQFLKQAYLPPLLCSFPLALTLAFLNTLFPIPSYPALVLEIAIGISTYGLCLVVLLAIRQPSASLRTRVLQLLSRPEF
jgi:O-antigen/teichoic acid export membrane protein